MIEILHTIQEYVPYTLDEDGKKVYDNINVVGDQLTVDKAVNAIKSVMNGYTEEDKLGGLNLAIADWHTGMKMLEVGCNL